MLIHDHQYLQKLRTLLKDAQEASVAVAFWGEGSESLFEGWNGKPLRILCNLELGGTNPRVIRDFMALKNAEIRQLDNLHAKLVLTDTAMIVGSANMSSNGLGLEAGEAKGFRELGILSQDAGQLMAARAWFEDLWEDSAPINESDLDKAQKAWEKRRNARPWTSDSGSTNLLDHPAPYEALQGREIYFVIWQKHLSPEASARLKKENESLKNENKKKAGSGAKSDDGLDAYEGWGYDELPKDPKAVIIPIYWGERGAINIDGAQRPYPERGDGPQCVGNGDRVDFTIKVKDTSTLGLPFSLPSNDERWHNKIRKWLKVMIDGSGSAGEPPKKCIPVSDFLDWHKHQDG